DWTEPTRMVPPDSAERARNRLSQTLGLLLLIGLLVAGSLLARRNYRAGRADRAGALRLASVMFALEILLWLCRSHLVPAWETFGNFMLCIASGLLMGGVTWMLYLALEPWNPPALAAGHHHLEPADFRPAAGSASRPRHPVWSDVRRGLAPDLRAGVCPSRPHWRGSTVGLPGISAGRPPGARSVAFAGSRFDPDHA